MPRQAPDPGPRLTRRRLLQLGLALPLPLVVAACDAGTATDQADPAASPTTASPPATTATAGGTLAPTPACDDGGDPTPAQTEGPYFTPNSPERASLLEAGLPGQRLVIAGTVLATDCRPVGRALLDFWQADDAGEYDNQGYRLRGHQFSDAKGGWRLETVVPGIYTGRTRHIHVKVQAPNRPVLTTQLYFPGEPGNAGDGIFQQELLLADVRDAGGSRRASFTFVLDA
jgi:protocatechuate 3,4-dioxygenase beta subunit